ncbi:HNH endonuclease [Amphibacillus sp. Q70]|uniref:HNH endonuclease n=1 Tax=Amphibacillus sp. Q70 TaxID=3453416 RepID=UPI003F85623F
MLGYHPYSKEQQLYQKKKKGKNKDFSSAVKLAIFKRDRYMCVKCGNHLIDSVPHHITYKSQGGMGNKRNGATVCRRCHNWAHHKCEGPYGEQSSEGRKWFEDWRNRKLNKAGDLK